MSSSIPSREHPDLAEAETVLGSEVPGVTPDPGPWRPMYIEGS